MTTRRAFLAGMAALPLAAASAAPPASRIALVMGNGSYRQHPLRNAKHDALAISSLFRGAEIEVITETDLTRSRMLEAIEAFLQRIASREVRQAFFYYAGHGVQLDWANYLLPVDAKVGSRDDVRAQCVELGTLLRKIEKRADLSVVVILDACRDDPFGTDFKPEQRGLSQFDAPSGTLLAYSTAPGSVASDGLAENGLYTENLLRELSVRGSKLEDALKRVRLNVRLASGGRQVPWESTSLESDVFLHGDPRPVLSDTDLERAVQEDVDAWNLVKHSAKPADYVAYLKKFPNGRFAEIAQRRLIRFLQEPGKPGAPAAAVEGIVLDGGPNARQIAPRPSPFSAGRFALGRRFSPGDVAAYRMIDLVTGRQLRRYNLRVDAVELQQDRVVINSGTTVFDSMGNWIRNPEVAYQNPRQIYPAELYVGNKWTAVYEASRPGGDPIAGTLEFRIPRRETIELPAGGFDAFLIEGIGSWGQTPREERFWVLPSINFPLQFEQISRNASGAITRAVRRELLSLRQVRFEPPLEAS